jgi:hypothetical protein
VLICLFKRYHTCAELVSVTQSFFFTIPPNLGEVEFRFRKMITIIEKIKHISLHQIKLYKQVFFVVYMVIVLVI